MELNGWTWTFGEIEGAGENATVVASRLNAVQLTPPSVEPPPAMPGGCPRDTVAVAQGAKDCNTVEWRLSKIVDPYGNEMIYDYRADIAPASLASDYGTGATRQPLIDQVRYFEFGGGSIGRIDFDIRRPTRSAGLLFRRGADAADQAAHGDLRL